MQRDEWHEAESAQVDTTQPESEQQQPVPSPVQQWTQNPPPDSLPVTPPPEPNQEVAPAESAQPMQRQRRMKQKDQRFPQPRQKKSTQKKRTHELRKTTAFPEIPQATHELATILQFGTSYELIEWLARRLQCHMANVSVAYVFSYGLAVTLKLRN